MLFTNGKRCFTKRYLKFHADMAFRQFTTGRGTAWCYRASFGDDEMSSEYGRNVQSHFNEEHLTGIVYYHAIQELDAVGLAGEVVIGDEISHKAIEKYAEYMNHHGFPPERQILRRRAHWGRQL